MEALSVLEVAPASGADNGAAHETGASGNVEMTAAPAAVTPPAAAAAPAVAAKANPAPQPTRRRGHRPESDVWRYLTRDPKPHRLTISRCMHCNKDVHHHRKSEKARAHLNRCVVFRIKMSKVSEHQRPDWVDLTIKLRGKKARSEQQLELPTRDTAAVATSLLPVTTQFTAKKMPQVPQKVVPNDPSPDLAQSKPPVLAVESRPNIQPEPSKDDAAALTASGVCASGGVREALAMHCYVTGVPLASLSEKHLAAAFQRAAGSENSVVQIPSPSELTGKLLDDAWAATRTQIDAEVEACKVNTLTCNSWWGQPADETLAVHYAVWTAERALLLETTRPTSSQWEDPEFREVELMRVMENCKHNVCGAITDCSQASQLVWRKLRAQFPAKFFHGCVSHGLNLLIEDIFGPQGPSEALATGGDDSMDLDSDSKPFAELRRLTENCRVVSKLLQQDEQANTELMRMLQMEGNSCGNVPTLHFPADKHWHELKDGFESFLTASGVLRRVVAEPSFVTEAPIYCQGQRVYITNTVLHPDFVSSLEKAVAILEPINSLLTRFERPGVPCSEVFASFAKTLPDALSSAAGLNERERSHLLLLNQSRFNLMYGDGLGIAYLLDPKYVGEGLSVNVRKNVEDIIFGFPVAAAGGAGGDGDGSSEEHKFDMAQQLTEYVIDATRERTNRSFRYSMLIKDKKTVLQYWLTDGQRWPLLQQLACQIFSLPPSSVTLEREIAQAGALANGLKASDAISSVVVDKMHFVRANNRLLAQLSSSASHAAHSSC